MKTNLTLALTTCVLSGFIFLGASLNSDITPSKEITLAEVQKVPRIHLPPSFYCQLILAMCTETSTDLCVVGAQEQVFQFEHQLNQIK